MKSQGKHVMDFIEKIEISTVFKGDFEWQPDAEAKLDAFLKQYPDPRLRDAKQKVESLRMELRETRKMLEKANEDFDQLQWDV